MLQFKTAEKHIYQQLTFLNPPQQVMALSPSP